MKYNFLDADEAEERFEKRNKTLNYFSIMLSKKLKDSEEGEEEKAAGAGEGGKDVKVKERKKAGAAADSGLVKWITCGDTLPVMVVYSIAANRQ